MASRIAGRSSRNSRSLTCRTKWLGPVTLGHARGERRFVLRRAAELLEGKRDRADFALARVPHEAKKRAGVDARREKDAHLDIGQEMRPHAVKHCRPHAFRQFGRRCWTAARPQRG